MKKLNVTTISLIVFVLLVVGLLLAVPNDSANTSEIKTSTSALVADRELHDFGEVDIFGGKVTTEFVLTNNGTEDITIVAGTTSCGCTNGEIGGIPFGMHERMKSNFTIPAGVTENLNVIYDPLAHGPNATGLNQRSIFLKTNSELTPELEVRIKVLVTKNE